MNYATAKRTAKELYGDAATIRGVKTAKDHLKCQIWMDSGDKKFALVGAGSTWLKAFASIRRGNGKRDTLRPVDTADSVEAVERPGSTDGG